MDDKKSIELIRPMSEDRYFLVGVLGGICFVAGGLAAIVASAIGWEHLAHPVLLLAVGVGVFLAPGLAMITAGLLRLGPAARHMQPIVAVALFVPPPAITLAQIALGPAASAAIFYCMVPIFAYFMMTPLRAWILVGVVTVLYGSVFLVQEGYPIPWATWFSVVVAVASTCYAFGRLIRSAVDESERSARLRHFLAPSVADALLSGDHGGVLTPHRREIAVFFADLRGFTSFAARAEPEEVLAVLNEYYDTVGAVLHRHGATIGDYIGDGIMAYLNDPIPVSDPAGTAIRMAREARDELLPRADRWSRRGYELSFGIGVAFGHATLGVVGFSERRSYAPLGTVVNLAARLCGAATDGEILIDRRAAAELEDDWQANATKIALKGLGDEVTVFRLPAAATTPP